MEKPFGDGRQMKDIPRRNLPAGLKEGDVIRLVDGIYVFDELKTERIKKVTTTMFDKLWE